MLTQLANSQNEIIKFKILFKHGRKMITVTDLMNRIGKK